MQLLIENGYVTSYVVIGSVTNGIEFDEANLPENFFDHFEPNKYLMTDAGIVVLSDEYVEKEDVYVPSNVEVQMAQTTLQLTQTAAQVQKTQKELASAVIESSKKDERIQMLEQQQADTMLEIAKLKGEI